MAAARSARWIPTAVVLVTAAAASCAPGSGVQSAPAAADPARLAEIEEHVVRQLVGAHLDRYLRLQRIAGTLRRANLDRCAASGGDLGITLLSRDLIPDWMAPMGTPLLQMENAPRIVDVRPGSPADAAGIEVGDWLVSLGGRDVGSTAELVRVEGRAPATVRLGISRDDGIRTVELVPEGACPPNPLRLVVHPEPAAFAQEGRIIVTTGLLAFTADDDELAFVLAHEMGHLLLGHTRRTASGGMESDADLMALDLMTGAGFNGIGALTFLLRLAAESHVPVDRAAIVVRLAVLEARLQEAAGRAGADPPDEFPRPGGADPTEGDGSRRR